jgi:hypothetical protein
LSRARNARSARLFVPALPLLAEGEGTFEDVEVVTAGRAFHRFADAFLVEQVPELRLVDHVRELVVGEDVREVDAEPWERRDGDALVGRHVAPVQVPRLVEPDPLRRDAFVRDNDIDERGGIPSDAVELRERFMAQRRAFSARIDGGEKRCLARQRGVPDRVDTAVDPVQFPGPHPLAHRAVVDTQRVQLFDPNQPAPAPRHPRDRSVVGG